MNIRLRKAITASRLSHSTQRSITHDFRLAPVSKLTLPHRSLLPQAGIEAMCVAARPVFTALILALGWLAGALLNLGELSAATALAAPSIDLSRAVIVVRPGELPKAESAAATGLIEEFAARTGTRLDRTSAWTDQQTVIAITTQAEVWLLKQ